MKIQGFLTVRLLTLLCLLMAVLSCEKDGAITDEVKAANWEIVRNFPQDQSYTTAGLAIHDGQVFVTTSGHSGIAPGSGANLHEFRGSFFYHASGSWYLYRSSNEAIIHLKPFKGALYGITERKIPFQSGYRHTYYLFKWEKDNFKNLDTLTYTNNNLIQQAPLSQSVLWGFNDKIYWITSASSGLVKIWTIENDRLRAHPSEYPLHYTNFIATDHKHVAFVTLLQLDSQTRSTHTVTASYFDGTSVNKGKTHTFFSEEGNPASNLWDYYFAAGNHLYGIRPKEIRNLDQDRAVVSLPSDRQFNSGQGYTLLSNGKTYNVISDLRGTCRELGIFDGQTYRRLDFQLPGLLDPCSKLVDAAEAGGAIYLLLLNRGQYVTVKSV